MALIQLGTDTTKIVTHTDLSMQASEFEQEFSVRLEEKSKLKAINCKNIRFKITTTPGGWTTCRKISAILQAQVNARNVDVFFVLKSLVACTGFEDVYHDRLLPRCVV